MAAEWRQRAIAAALVAAAVFSSVPAWPQEEEGRPARIERRDDVRPEERPEDERRREERPADRAIDRALDEIDPRRNPNSEIHIEAKEVVWRGPVDLAEIERLNIPDPSTKKLKPAEAAAAAEFEQYRNCRLEREIGPDFIIVSGVEKGKTVDFMLTAESNEESRQMSRNLRESPESFYDSLSDHVRKADIVPIDARHLDKDNIIVVKDSISKMPLEKQKKVILIVGD